MKLSKTTLDILENFARINTQVTIRKGSWQASMADPQTVCATMLISTTFPEVFPVDFSLDKLSSFLSVVSMFDPEDLELEFGPQEVALTGRGGASKITWRYSSPDVIRVKPPTKESFDQVLGNFDTKVSFEFPWVSLDWIMDAAKTLVLPDLGFHCDGKTVRVINLNEKDNSTSTQALTLQGAPGPLGVAFKAIYEAKSLQFLEDDYTVHVSSKGTAKFQAKTLPVTYFVACKPDKIEWNA